MRNFKLPVLGKFTVVMADPPWDIHMELPYGTMSDDEMRSVKLSSIQPTTGMGVEFGGEFSVLFTYFFSGDCLYQPYKMRD